MTQLTISSGGSTMMLLLLILTGHIGNSLSVKIAGRATDSMMLYYIQEGVDISEDQLKTSEQHKSLTQQLLSTTQQQSNQIQQLIDVNQQNVAANQQLIHDLQKLVEVLYRPRDCSEIKPMGSSPSGIYTIYPYFSKSIDALCDMESGGGGWTLIQRRQDGSVDFFRNWRNYTMGFGDIGGEFWLGLDHIHQLTSQKTYDLRIDMWDKDGEHRHALYNNFRIGDESDDYRISFKGYSGNAGDSLDYHDDMRFSTYDKDNDKEDDTNCAVEYKSGWWFKKCHQANLNGEYNNDNKSEGVTWEEWHGKDYSLPRVEMKIKPSSD